ncbi:MAG: ASCH domain-containing protein [Candidatus Parabeggiatoa sp.]|nr:ASCH domain-containing protein [Candidatus Parabeggiatoa sp.]
MKGLIIRQPWLDLILSGQKTFEMRSKLTRIRGEIGLIQSGSGLVLGTAHLLDCVHLMRYELEKYQDKHCVDLQNPLLDKYRWAWQLSDARRFDKPLPYKHSRGAVIWVNLTFDKCLHQEE